jgi:BTB/POZ domain
LDVQVLKFQDAFVNYIPRGFNKIFPNLVELRFINCGLNKITSEDLIGFEKIEVLDLSRNELTFLSDDLFINTPKLKEISFYRNKIENMSSKMLKLFSNNELTMIDFRKNDKIDAIFGHNFMESVNSFEDLMKIIDTQCIKPIGNSFKETKQGNPFPHQNYTHLWLTGKFSDFFVAANRSKRFRVHKHILATQSQVFSEMFENDEYATKMKIKDASAEAIEEFLRCFYTGVIKNEITNSVAILVLATKFQVPEMKKLAEKIIISDFKKSNAYRVYGLGLRYESDVLKNAALEKIQERPYNYEIPVTKIYRYRSYKTYKF